MTQEEFVALLKSTLPATELLRRLSRVLYWSSEGRGIKFRDDDKTFHDHVAKFIVNIQDAIESSKLIRDPRLSPADLEKNSDKLLLAIEQIEQQYDLIDSILKSLKEKLDQDPAYLGSPAGAISFPEGAAEGSTLQRYNEEKARLETELANIREYAVANQATLTEEYVRQMLPHVEALKGDLAIVEESIANLNQHGGSLKQYFFAEDPELSPAKQLTKVMQMDSTQVSELRVELEKLANGGIIHQLKSLLIAPPSSPSVGQPDGAGPGGSDGAGPGEQDPRKRSRRYSS